MLLGILTILLISVTCMIIYNSNIQAKKMETVESFQVSYYDRNITGTDAVRWRYTWDDDETMAMKDIRVLERELIHIRPAETETFVFGLESKNHWDKTRKLIGDTKTVGFDSRREYVTGTAKVEGNAFISEFDGIDEQSLGVICLWGKTLWEYPDQERLLKTYRGWIRKDGIMIIEWMDVKECYPKPREHSVVNDKNENTRTSLTYLPNGYTHLCEWTILDGTPAGWFRIHEKENWTQTPMSVQKDPEDRWEGDTIRTYKIPNWERFQELMKQTGWRIKKRTNMGIGRYLIILSPI